jgi:hypothetical protein
MARKRKTEAADPSSEDYEFPPVSAEILPAADDAVGSEPTPWSAGPRESTQAFRARMEYQNLGIGKRSLLATAMKIESHVSLMGRWSTQHGWVRLAAQFDAHEARNSQVARDKQNALATRHWEVARDNLNYEMLEVGAALIARMREMLAHPLTVTVTGDNGGTEIHPAKWNAASIALFAKLGTDLQTQAIASALDADDFDPITATDDECRAYLVAATDHKKAMLQLTHNKGGA